MTRREEFNRQFTPPPSLFALSAPQYVPDSYDSPIETELAYQLSKRLRPGAILTPQVAFSTPVGRFRADLVLHTHERNTVIECDGREFHLDLEKDQKRDQAIVATELAEGVLRFSGAQILSRIHDVIYLVMLFHPEAFDDRGRALCSRLASDGVKTLLRCADFGSGARRYYNTMDNEYRSPDFLIVWTGHKQAP